MVLGFVIESASISKLFCDAAYVIVGLKNDLFQGYFAI